MSYYTWNLLVALPSNLDYNGSLCVVVDLVSELVRYVTAAFVLGATYRHLPTR